jgi:D-alanyl-D-alanine carboxypeptidase
MRRLAACTVIFHLLAPSPALGSESRLPDYSDAEFVRLAELAELENLVPPGPPSDITGNAEVDYQIRVLAEARGYVLRPVPAGPLVEVDGELLQAPAAGAWKALKRDTVDAGFSIRLVSGYRSVASQASVFVAGAGGSTMRAYESRLAWSAPPGYSKHHTGYVIDLALPGQSHNSFGRSEVYRWLVADNYEVLKGFGFVPSYPPGGPPQGPNPEAWEYSYVGIYVIRCGHEMMLGSLARSRGDPPPCPS